MSPGKEWDRPREARGRLAGVDERLHHGVNWSGEDLAGGFVSEKLDGVRCWWDGSRAWTRSGREIALPDGWRGQLPAGVPLDGELWAGRGRFSAASVAVRLGRIGVPVGLWIFDAPRAPGSWPERMAFARRSLGLGAHVRVVAWRRCGSTAAVLDIARQVLAQGGEGVMVRSPLDDGGPGRHDSLVKVKTAMPWSLPACRACPPPPGEEVAA